MKLPKVHLQYPQVGKKTQVWISLNLPKKQIKYSAEGKPLRFHNLPGFSFAVVKGEDGRFTFTEMESGRRIAIDDTEQKVVIRGLQRLETTLSKFGVAYLRKAIDKCAKVATLSEDAPRSQCDKHSDEPAEVEEVEAIKF